MVALQRPPNGREELLARRLVPQQSPSRGGHYARGLDAQVTNGGSQRLGLDLGSPGLGSTTSGLYLESASL